jgi:Flp pilus assembly protein TadG
MRYVRNFLKRLKGDESGVAAIEFAFVAPVIIVAC